MLWSLIAFYKYSFFCVFRQTCTCNCFIYIFVLFYEVDIKSSIFMSHSLKKYTTSELQIRSLKLTSIHSSNVTSSQNCLFNDKVYSSTEGDVT